MSKMYKELVRRFHINKKEFIDKLFKKSNEAGNIVYRNSKKRNVIEKVKEAELQRIETFFQILDSFLFNIIHSFPRYEELHIFYQKLLDVLIGKKEFKVNLARLNNLRRVLREEKVKVKEKIKRSKNKEEIIKLRKYFFGRMLSFFDEINFDKLNKWVEIIYSFPKIDEKSVKIVILGMPNVGKSTLLSKLTSSKPKIADYEFTTTIINRGIIKEKIEVFDTPGLLDRDFDKLNKIEREAYIAFTELGNICIFVFDPTKNLEKQYRVFKRFYNKGKEKKWLFYISKEDILSSKEFLQFKNRLINKLEEEKLLNSREKIYSSSNLFFLKEKIEKMNFK